MWPMLKKHPIIPHNFQDLNGVLKWETNSHKGSWVSRMTASACGRVSVKSLWISAAGFCQATAQQTAGHGFAGA